MSADDDMDGCGHPEFLKKIGHCAVKIFYTPDEDEKGSYYFCEVALQDEDNLIKSKRKVLLEEKVISDFLYAQLGELGMFRKKLTFDKEDNYFFMYFCPLQVNEDFDHIDGLYAQIARALDSLAPSLSEKVQAVQKEIETPIQDKLAKDFGVSRDIVREILIEGRALERQAYKKIITGRAA